MDTFTQQGQAVTIYRCSVCGRTADEYHVRDWLIGSHRDPEKRANGEMVIRCPDHITPYAKHIVA